jgi:hypothetical protein
MPQGSQHGHAQTRDLRGLERLHQERPCASRARRTNAAGTDAKLVVSGHVTLIGCQEVSDDNALPMVARSFRYGARFANRLNLRDTAPRPTARTLRLLSCPPRSPVSSANLPSCGLNGSD